MLRCHFPALQRLWRFRFSPAFLFRAGIEPQSDHKQNGQRGKSCRHGYRQALTEQYLVADGEKDQIVPILPGYGITGISIQLNVLAQIVLEVALLQAVIQRVFPDQKAFRMPGEPSAVRIHRKRNAALSGLDGFQSAAQIAVQLYGSQDILIILCREITGNAIFLPPKRYRNTEIPWSSDVRVLCGRRAFLCLGCIDKFRQISGRSGRHVSGFVNDRYVFQRQDICQRIQRVGRRLFRMLLQIPSGQLRQFLTAICIKLPDSFHQNLLGAQVLYYPFYLSRTVPGPVAHQIERLYIERAQEDGDRTKSREYQELCLPAAFGPLLHEGKDPASGHGLFLFQKQNCVIGKIGGENPEQQPQHQAGQPPSACQCFGRNRARDPDALSVEIYGIQIHILSVYLLPDKRAVMYPVHIHAKDRNIPTLEVRLGIIQDFPCPGRPDKRISV